jgi:two-component system cell cycle sensor histidine kinase/response regulator CckA
MLGATPSALRRFSRTTGLLVALLGCLVLAGWVLDVAVLKSVVPGLTTMKGETALGFVPLGLSLWLLTPAPGSMEVSSRRRLVARVLAAAVAVLGALVLGEYLFGWRVGIDQIFVDRAPASSPGRMSPLAALDFMLLGSALLAPDFEGRRHHRPAQFFALVAGVIGFVAAVGYAFTITSSSVIPSFTTMALHTSIAFTVASLAVLCAEPDRGIPALLLATGPGGTMARGIVPLIFLLMTALGWLTLVGQRAGLYSTEVAVGLIVIATIVFFTVMASATDMADARHRMAKDSIHQSELRKKAMLDAALDAVITIDDQGRIVEFNPAAEQLFGYSRSEAAGREMAELIIPPAFRDGHRRGLARHVATGQARILGKRIEMPALRKDGSVFPAEIAITRVDTGKLPLFTGYLRDISDRKRVEEELQKSEERFRLVSNATSDVVWDWSLLENSVWWNEGVQKVFGYDSAAASADPLWWAQHVEPADLPRVLQGMQLAVDGTGTSWRDEYRFKKADGSIAQVFDRGFIIRDAAGRAIRMIGATVDMTERLELEAQLRQSQKIEAVGQLAGGIAHDFNNLLTAVLGYTEILERQVMDRLDLAEPLSEIRKAAERAAALTRQLLAFSRRQVLEPRVLDLNSIVRNLEGMLRRLIGEDIDLVATLDPSLAPVLADAGQMEQVIVNLVVNSRDAMPQGGRLTIETGNVDLDESYASRHAAVRPGAFVMLAVSDTGQGMTAETQQRIFEPFFTTKGRDKGTGLGLSTVYGIVKQSGGYVWVYSELEKGTTVKVYLPRGEGSVVVPVETRAAPPAGPATGTILLVEDDATLLKLARRILAGLGYTILEAGKGEEGLKIAREHPGHIDLLLTDVVMPGMGGANLAAGVRQFRPEIRVLFMSGYTDSAIVRHDLLQAGTAFLQKPFTPSSLGQKVREVLAGPA